MDNIKLLEYCSKNPEKFLDTYYMFVEKHQDLNKYVETTREIKNTLIALKEVKDKKNSSKIVEQLLRQLYGLMPQYSNNSEFGCFINACDSSLEEVLFDKSLLKKITFLYLEKRDLNDIVPGEWIQALIDKRAATKKGDAGVKKLTDILKEHGYVKAENYLEFSKIKKVFATCKKTGDFSNSGIKKHFKVSIGKKTQNKILDLIIKNVKDTFFLEAKHMKTSGGLQNKQASEFINILNYKTHTQNQHFVSFLDGIYFNKLFGTENAANRKEQDKIIAQKTEIKSNLRKNKQNYFLNSAGFKKMF